MKGGTKDYYQILGLQRDASSEDVRKAYRTYAAKFHPDKHDGDAFFEERFREVKEAYETLYDIEKRVRYDIRKFGKSRAVRRTDPDDLDYATEPARPKPKRKFMIDISHIEIYFTLFYLINLAAWVMIKRIHDHASDGGHIASLFLSGVSTMLMWLFITGLIDLIYHRYTARRVFLTAYLLLSLAIGCIPLVTNWIP